MLGTASGILYSASNGLDWQAMNTGLPYMQITGLSVNNNGSIFAGIGSAGVWTASPFKGSVAEFGVRPLTLACAPNPASDECTISYTLANPSKVQLSLIDPLGRELRAIELGRQESGAHTHQIEISKFPSGMYFCTLRAGSQVRKTKIVVNRQ